MSNAKTNNGPVRRTLASQLDRLDQILDTLSEGLNEAVATAVQEATGVAVRQAVQGVFTELLTNPEVLALVREVVGQPAAQPAASTERGTAQPGRTAGFWARLKAWLAAGLRRVGEACRLAWHHRGRLLSSLGVALAAAAAWFAAPWLAAAASRLGGHVAALAARVALAVRRTLPVALAR